MVPDNSKTNYIRTGIPGHRKKDIKIPGSTAPHTYVTLHTGISSTFLALARHVSCVASIGLTLLFLCGAALAGPPDAGTLLQEQRQNVPSLPDRLPQGPREETGPPSTGETGATVTVKAFRFTGIEKMATDAELQALVRDYVGKTLSTRQLQHVTDIVTDYLRQKKGYLLARAYLPRQDITAGIVEIAVVAGRIDGKVRYDIKQPARISPSLLAGIAEKNIPPGAVRMEHLERTVLLVNDLPGMQAFASLQPGDAPGTSRVVIQATEGRMFQGVFSGDNYGDRYTGSYRATGQLLALDPLGRGDQLTLSYTYAEQLNQWQAGYALPLGATGITWNTGYTGLAYELDKDLSDLKARGWAEIITTGVSYPFVRTRNKSIWGGVSAEYMMLRDEANGEKTRDRKLTNGVGYLSGNFFDTFAGGGLTNASLVATGGNVDLSGYSPNNDADDAGPRTYGGFVRANYFLARLQRITGPFALFGSIRGQFTPDNLDSSQKFILGGPSGVRAYPVGEAPADEGHALTLETRIDVPGLPLATQLIGFFDTGWVKLHHSPWPGSITNASGRNEYFLSGAGIGVNTVKPGIFNIRAFYAHTLGSNPGRSTSGNNADGLSDKGRFWLQLIVWI